MSAPLETSHIQRALSAGSMDLLRHAVDMGEDVRAFEKTGPSIITEMVRVCAERQSDPPSVSELLLLGADPNKPSHNGFSPLCFLMFRMGGDRLCVEGVIALLCAGADVNSLIDNQMCDMTWRPSHRECKSYPLALAIQVGSISSAEAILLAGASPDGPSGPDLLSPLSMAAKWKGENFISLLLRQNADPNRRNGDGSVAMHHCWDHATAQLLVDAGAIVNLADHRGRVPLHEWVEHVKDPAALVWLAEKAPDCRYVADAAGVTPLHILRERYAMDSDASFWAGEMVADWEAGLIAMQLDAVTGGSQGDTSSRRL